MNGLAIDDAERLKGFILVAEMDIRGVPELARGFLRDIELHEQCIQPNRVGLQRGDHPPHAIAIGTDHDEHYAAQRDTPAHAKAVRLEPRNATDENLQQHTLYEHWQDRQADRA